MGIPQPTTTPQFIMHAQTNKKILAEKRQRTLRKNLTDAESHLWQRLRNRQVGNCKFRRQHPCGDFILDFVCLERKVVVELDGGQHFDSAKYDAMRSQLLEQAGFAVLRFWNNEVFENTEGVLEVILSVLNNRGTPIPTLALPLKGRDSAPFPSPQSPPLQGEG
jgi:crossover junction endodeoxyribonuclease RuvC